MSIYFFGCLPYCCISQYPIGGGVSDGVPTEAIIGGAVGGLILFLIVPIVVIGLGCFLCKKKSYSGNVIFSLQ